MKNNYTGLTLIELKIALNDKKYIQNKVEIYNLRYMQETHKYTPSTIINIGKEEELKIQEITKKYKKTTLEDIKNTNLFDEIKYPDFRF